MGKWTSDGKKPVVVVGLSEGAFQVVFSGRGYEGRTEFFQIRGGECSHPLPWTVKMRPLTYRIIFLVTDEGNVPLSRIQVVVKGRKPVYSDIRGRVTVDQLRDGIHEAVFSRKGYLSTRASFRFQGGVCSLKLPHPVKLQKLNSDE
jgi:hypothetical protein